MPNESPLSMLVKINHNYNEYNFIYCNNEVSTKIIQNHLTMAHDRS